MTGTVAGGYYDKNQTKYTVTRLNDGKVVCESTGELSVTDELSNPLALTKTSYGVTATFMGKTSAQGVTSSIVTGEDIYPRWSDNFDNTDLNKLYTIIDGNGDGKTWSKNSSGMGCTSSAATAMDDWLITPAINMEAGKLYRITVNASAGYASQYTERFEVAMGRDKTVAAMTMPLISRTDIHHSTDKEYVGYADIKETGKYYLGVHGCSDAGSFRLDISEIRIDNAISAAAPAPADSLVVIPAEDGSPKAKFIVKAPSKTVAGNTLTVISDMKLIRDGVVVATVANPAPGVEVSFNDEVDKSGIHHYSIVAYNEEGEGKPLETDVHMGVNIAAAPLNVQVKETSTPGEVTISWEAPTLDKDGNAINPSLISYRVERLLTSGNVVVADNLKTTSFTYQANQHPKEQQFMAFGVFAVTKAGDSKGRGSETISVGIPYATPFRESFADARVIHNIGIKSIAGEGRWVLANNATFSNIHPQDGDNGLFVMHGPNLKDEGMFYSGRIDLSKVNNPVLTFYTYAIGDKDNEATADINTLNVSVDAGEGWVSEKMFRICDVGTGSEGWQRVDIDLTKYKGKIIQFGITGTVHKYQFIMVDNIRLGNMVADNLAITSISGVESVRPNTKHSVVVEVENSGSKVSTVAKVVLMRNGVEIKSADVESLDPGVRVKVAVDDELNVLASERHIYKARIDYTPDMDISDNESGEITVALQHHSYPNPTNLTGTQDNKQNVTLMWQAPDASSTHSITEDFESYASYSNSNIGNWTLIDGDKGFIGAIQNIPIPGIDQGSKQSYWVMDSNISENNTTFKAHSGNKYLAQMYVNNGTGAIACDDWLISPELSGAAQTISLFAKSYNSKYPETFQILYSSKSKDISDFVEIAKFKEISNVWTEYTAQIPVGAKYFAVRAVSYDCMMLFIDDITYQPALGDGIVSTGYNLYRNGVKINTTPIVEESYVDSGVPEGNHTYHVTALYEQGESRPSDSFELGVLTGVDSAIAAAARVYAENGSLHVITEEVESVEVNAINGTTAWTGNVCGHKVITLEKGIYVVRVADKTVKIKL